MGKWRETALGEHKNLELSARQNATLLSLFQYFISTVRSEMLVLMGMHGVKELAISD